MAKYYIKNVSGLTLPAKANPSDAGYDVIATSDPKIVGSPANGGGYHSISYIEYETNLFITPESGIHTDLRPRSSISSKTNLVLANSVGLIDNGYKNQVLARFKYVFQPEDLYTTQVYKDVGFGPLDAKKVTIINGNVNTAKLYKKGDAIAQLVASNTNDIEFVLVDELPGEDRGGGFGSSDAKRVLLLDSVVPSEAPQEVVADTTQTDVTTEPTVEEPVTTTDQVDPTPVHVDPILEPKPEESVQASPKKKKK